VINIKLEVNPKIIILCGVDRSGKTTLIQEINKQCNYKHITIDRATIGFRAYCEIFKRPKSLKKKYKKLEKILSKVLGNKILVIYLDCQTKELIRRCRKTNHKIIDFDYHKKIYEKCFNNSLYKNKIKIDSTIKPINEIVLELKNKKLI